MIILYLIHIQIQGFIYHNSNFGGIFESGERGTLWETVSTLYG